MNTNSEAFSSAPSSRRGSVDGSTTPTFQDAHRLSTEETQLDTHEDYYQSAGDWVNPPPNQFNQFDPFILPSNNQQFILPLNNQQFDPHHPPVYGQHSQHSRNNSYNSYTSGYDSHFYDYGDHSDSIPQQSVYSIASFPGGNSRPSLDQGFAQPPYFIQEATLVPPPFSEPLTPTAEQLDRMVDEHGHSCTIQWLVSQLDECKTTYRNEIQRLKTAADYRECLLNTREWTVKFAEVVFQILFTTNVLENWDKHDAGIPKPSGLHDFSYHKLKEKDWSKVQSYLCSGISPRFVELFSGNLKKLVDTNLRLASVKEMGNNYAHDGRPLAHWSFIVDELQGAVSDELFNAVVMEESQFDSRTERLEATQWTPAPAPAPPPSSRRAGARRAARRAAGRRNSGLPQQSPVSSPLSSLSPPRGGLNRRTRISPLMNQQLPSPPLTDSLSSHDWPSITETAKASEASH